MYQLSRCSHYFINFTNFAKSFNVKHDNFRTTTILERRRFQNDFRTISERFSNDRACGVKSRRFSNEKSGRFPNDVAISRRFPDDFRTISRLPWPVGFWSGWSLRTVRPNSEPPITAYLGIELGVIPDHRDRIHMLSNCNSCTMHAYSDGHICIYNIQCTCRGVERTGKVGARKDAGRDAL